MKMTFKKYKQMVDASEELRVDWQPELKEYIYYKDDFYIVISKSIKNIIKIEYVNNNVTKKLLVDKTKVYPCHFLNLFKKIISNYAIKDSFELFDFKYKWAKEKHINKKIWIGSGIFNLLFLMDILYDKTWKNKKWSKR